MTTLAPVFLIGVARSGTTLLALMLDSHSQIAIPYESHFIVPYYKNKAPTSDLGTKAGRLALSARILSEPAVSHWSPAVHVSDFDLDGCATLESTVAQLFSAYARRCGKIIWGDKTPSYTDEIHILNKMFPDARFIHLIRDGRDVALSLVQQWWGPNDFMSAVRHWALTVSCARKMLHMLPEDRFLEVKFEDLVADPQLELNKITRVLGVEFEPAMLTAYTGTARAKVGDHLHKHHLHLSQRPSATQALKWRNTLKPVDQAVAFEIAGPLFAELGYPSGVTSHPFKLFRKSYHRLRESYEWRFNYKKRLQDSANWGFDPK